MMSPNDTLTFYVENDEPNILKIQIETGEKNLKHTFEPLMDLMMNKRTGYYTYISGASVLRIPSNDFQKLCRDMNQVVTDEIEIKSSEVVDVAEACKMIGLINKQLLKNLLVDGGMSYIQI